MCHCFSGLSCSLLMFLFVEGFALAFGEFLVFSKVSGTGFDLIAHSVPFVGATDVSLVMCSLRSHSCGSFTGCFDFLASVSSPLMGRCWFVVCNDWYFKSCMLQTFSLFLCWLSVGCCPIMLSYLMNHEAHQTSSS